jgi:Carbohydrate esterase, sialic acid-specific acetylesterase
MMAGRMMVCFGRRGGAINQLMVYGQSLSVGQALPIQSGTALGDSLMFAGGMRPQYDHAGDPTVWYPSLVPAVEVAVNGLGETPCRGAADMVRQLVVAEGGANHQLLLSAPGYGATTVAQLSKGRAHYGRIPEQAAAGKACAASAGQAFATRAVAWVQGESDDINLNTSAAYRAAVQALFADINTDVKVAAAQPVDVARITYQVASHVYSTGGITPRAALAHRDLVVSDGWHMACPMYQFDYADGHHLTGAASRCLGAYIGLAYKRAVIDRRHWTGLQPISATRSGSTITVPFSVPVGALVLDTARVAAIAHSGFSVVNSVGDALTINSVAVSEASVTITLASAAPAGARVRYGYNGTSATGRTAGPRGNLRDQQGDTLVFDPAGTSWPMHNWAPFFDMAVSN